MSSKNIPAFIPIQDLCLRELYRALVLVPGQMTSGESSFEERTVFFEVGINQDPERALEMLLHYAWGIDTEGWSKFSWISNVESASTLRAMNGGFDKRSELYLLEYSRGGDSHEAVGPYRVHYAREFEIDLFVTPRARARLSEVIGAVELLAELEPSRRRAPRLT